MEENQEMVLWGGKTIGAQPWNLATRAGIIPDYYLHGAMVNLDRESATSPSSDEARRGGAARGKHSH